eukprot:TRINITY_DN93616_c0_g1_i1.p1 TRINITY_DN93616_c0_g1~~TRINITY_DN93616_c0_g1_i1.p1  ORF type:complete len:386 (+),score=58.98 TRINITY_DN93616_c0_g1_i1:150-1160(+)
MALTQSLVGEPFTGYLNLSNVSKAAVLDVNLKAELQIGTSKFTLFNNTMSPISSLAPGAFFDALVDHSLRDAGTYVLSCQVSYTALVANEPTHFKRSYRFPALQPFAVSHRIAQLDRQLLVECAVENATSGSIYLSSCNLDCVDGFRSLRLGGGTEDESQGGGSRMHLLKPRGSHSVIFRVEPLDESEDMAAVRKMDTIGTLAIGWHVPDGPTGCVEGHQLRVRPSPAQGLDMQVIKCPKRVEVEVPFQLEFEVVNRTISAVEPRVNFDIRLMGAVRIHGPVHRTLGRLEPDGRATFSVDLLVSAPGLHGLQGIYVTDSVAQTKAEFGVLCDILAF